MYTNLDCLRNKRSELLHIIADYDPDIVCLTEITPKNSRYPLELLELQIPGYDSFTNVNDGSCHLGVIIYARTKLHAVPSKTIKDFRESVWCEIPLIAQDRLLLGCIYRSPNSTEENTHILQESLSEMTTGRSHVAITGDFDQPDIDWSDNLFPKDPDCKATDFLESVRDSFFCQHMKELTYYRSNQRSNTLGLVFTKEEDMVTDVEHWSPLGKSHHQTLLFSYICYSEDKPPQEVRYNFPKGDYTKLAGILNDENWEKLDSLDAHNSWQYLNDKIKTTMADSISLKTQNTGTKKQKPQWMNETALKKNDLKRNMKHIKDTYMLEKEQPTWNTAKLGTKISHVVGKQSVSFKNQ